MLGNDQLSLLPVCPECHQQLISYQDRCNACGWQGTPVQVKQQGIILRDLGDKFEIVLNNGSVKVFDQLNTYPLPDTERQLSYPLEKLNYPLEKSKKPSPSGTLYPYTVTRRNKKGIQKQYQYWAYSYEVKDPKTGKWKSKKKSVPRGKREQVSYAIAQKKPVSYILSILEGQV